MAIPPGGRETVATLEIGKPYTSRGNSRLRHKIVFVSGTTIECIIPANGQITVCHMGDIKSFDTFIDPEAVTDLHVVEKS